MKPQIPCRVNGVDCPKRQPACSDTCPEYQKYHQHVVEVRERRRQEKEITRAVFERIEKFNRKPKGQR